MKKLKFKDDVVDIKENDIDAIRRRPSMWISSSGEAGVFHLCKEIIDNHRDECFKKESMGDHIQLKIDKHSIWSRDNGRGIPTDLLQVIFETTQAGSNMTRTGGATAGENGVGSTCVLALSSELIVTTIRPNEHKKLTLIYKEAQLVEKKLEDYDGDDHGLIVFFKPSKKILGVSTIPVDDIATWIRDFNYTLPYDIKMDYEINGKSYQVHHKEIRELIYEQIGKDNLFPAQLQWNVQGELKEIVQERPYDRKFSVQFAIAYADPDKYKGEDLRHSWMNMIHTIDNGSHVDGVLNGFIKYMTEAVVAKNKKLDGIDLKKDILAHLSIVVNASCDCATMFSSQSKHKVFLKSLGMAIANAVYEELSNRPNLINSMIEIIIGNHRARMAGEQARNIKSLVTVKKKWTTPDTFLPCASIKTEQPKEIYFVEGNSAGGGLNGARDARYQAVLFSKGKPSNVYDAEDATKVFASDSWKNVVPTLGCGVGDTFDMKKLQYDMIIICTDADIDGYHIRTLFLTFFMRYLPELIKAGKLYIAEPPLYKLVSGKNVQYVATQTEYIQACIKSISDLKIQFSGKNAKCSIQDFVKEAFNYLDTLIECSINRSVNRYLLEYIAFGIAQYGTVNNFIKHIDEWLRNVTTNFKEIGYDHKTNQVYAVIDLIDNFVLLDDELMVELADVINVIQKYGLIIHYVSNKRNIDRMEELSKFFEYIESVYPKIKGRYKGLGSSDPEVLREVVMDPRTRRIYQVTIEDIMTWEKMASIAGGSRDDINKRKEILMNFKFTKADIDN